MAIMPVTGNAAHVVFDSLALFYQSVEKRGFAHIRPTYYCYYICHDQDGSYPNFLSFNLFFLQSCSTLTKVSRKTFFPKNFSNSARDSIPTFFSIFPLSPMMMPF